MIKASVYMHGIAVPLPDKTAAWAVAKPIDAAGLAFLEQFIISDQWWGTGGVAKQNAKVLNGGPELRLRWLIVSADRFFIDRAQASPLIGIELNDGNLG